MTLKKLLASGTAMPSCRRLLSGFAAASAAVGTANAAVMPASAAPEDDPFAVVALRDRPLGELAEIAGAVDRRDSHDWIDNYADDVADGVFFAAGVSVNAVDIQEPRLSIRGFALGGGQQRSNVRYLRDGAPLTDVHGTSHASEVDLLSTEEIVVLRGAPNLREAGGNLGGVVSLVSKTGRSVAPGIAGRLDGASTIDGKFGGQGHARIADAKGGVDYYAGVTGVYENGWRDNNRRTSEQFHGNVGVEITDRIKTRLFADVVNSQTELAGGLTLADLAESAQQPTPPITLGPLFPGGPVFSLVDGARQDDFARDVLEGRIANTTEIDVLGHDIVLGGHYARRDVDNPQIDFVGYFEESGSEWGARLEIGRTLPAFNGEVRYRVGGAYATGSRTHERFDNVNGAPGDRFAAAEQKSKLVTAFVEGVYKPVRRIAVDIGAKLIMSDRTVTDLLDDNNPETRDDTGVAARGGVLFELSEAMDIYISASRTYEPPSMDELTFVDPADFEGLNEQDAFTLEAGLRGRIGDWIGYDVAYYDADIENEIIQLGDPASFVSGAIYDNADKTTHKGVEVGLDIHLFPEAFAARGGALTLRNVYAYSDHAFVDSGIFDIEDGARLAGTPEHAYRGELRYDAGETFFVAANLQLAGGAYFADHANTTNVPTEPIVGLSAGYRLNDRMEVFASGENLLDKGYVAGVSPVLTYDPVDGRTFTPGARASVYGGLKVRF